MPSAATRGSNLVRMVQRESGVAADCAHQARTRSRSRRRRRRELLPGDVELPREVEDDEEEEDEELCVCVRLVLERLCGVPLTSVSATAASLGEPNEECCTAGGCFDAERKDVDFVDAAEGDDEDDDEDEEDDVDLLLDPLRRVCCGVSAETHRSRTRWPSRLTT